MNIQISIFDEPPPRPPYLDAKAGRDFGMQRAIDHADATRHDWSEGAYDLLKTYSRIMQEFMTEDVRLWADSRGFAPPPDTRAWGAVVNRAVREGLIVRTGYAPSKTGHMRPTAVWKRT